MKNNTYFERYIWPEALFPEYTPSASTQLIVVIPAFNEQHILKAIKSLNKCEDISDTLIIVVINESEYADSSIHAQNEKCFNDLLGYESKIPILTKHIQLPHKKAGVGLARKIGMDEAVRQFDKIEKNGIIVCFDADCTCEKNYISSIKDFYQDKSNNVGLLHYEHDLYGNNNDAIINYELFLRYYINGLRFCGFPFAVQTLGSCITVKSEAYQKQVGMNTRKAAEDFYFIHKMTELGGIGEINDTCIYPSDRVSDRVPFGTGHAIGKFLAKKSDNYEAYNPQTFIEIKQFLESLEYLYECDDLREFPCTETIKHFLTESDFASAFAKIKKQSPNYKNFQRRFFAWFDGLKILKLTHFLRDHYYPNIDIVDALGWLNQSHLKDVNLKGSKEAKLIKLREYDRTQDYWIK